jgi:hypothetical protein
MAKTNKWWRASLRQPLMNLPAGHAILVIRSKVEYTSIGITYWVMSCCSSVVYQVAESYGGPELRHILKYEREAYNQHLIVEKANRLLVNYKLANYKSPSKGKL